MVTDNSWTTVKAYSSSLFFVFFFAVIASLGSARAPEIYSKLVLPDWAPDSSLFGPVWAVLYILMGVSLGIFRSSSDWKAHPLIASLFLTQLLLNAAWSWFFFSDENILLALWDIVILNVLVFLLLLLLFRRGFKFCAFLLVPYFCWIFFACMLTSSIRLNNPSF